MFITSRSECAGRVARRLLALYGCLMICTPLVASPLASSHGMTAFNIATASSSSPVEAHAGNLWSHQPADAAPGRRLTATFVNPGLPGERFWDMVTETMQAAADDLNISLEVVHARRNPYLMQQLGIQALERANPPEYLVLVNEEQAASTLLTVADSSDSHVVILLNGLTRAQELTDGTPGSVHPSWIGSVIPDNHTAGKRMATQLIAKTREQYPVGELHGLALIGDTTTPGSIDRNAGMLAGFADDKAVTIDRILEARWNLQDAERMTGQYLEWARRSNLQNDLIWAANDAMAQGAIRAIEASGLQAGKDVLVAGLNWSPEGISRVADHRMLLTDGGHFMGGAWAMVMLRDHADIEGWEPRTVNFPMSAITHDNVEIYGPLLLTPGWKAADFTAFRLQSSQDTYGFDPLKVLDQINAMHSQVPQAIKKNPTQ